MRFIKEKGKRYIALLIVCVMTLGLFPMGVYAEPSALGTPVQNLAAGSYINFGGRTWRLADPSTGYLVMTTKYEKSKWSTTDNTDATTIFTYLDDQFNTIITVEAHRNMIENTEWDIRGIATVDKDSLNPTLTTTTNNEASSISPASFTQKLGIISLPEWNTMKGDIGNPDEFSWTRSPHASNITHAWKVDVIGRSYADVVDGVAYWVRPALYLKSGITVAGGSGTVDTPYTLAFYDATQDNEDIGTAKGNIEGATYTATQVEAGDVTAAAIKAQSLVNALDTAGTTAVVVPGNFTAAVAGDSGTPAGTNGSFTFTVTINKGGGTEQISAQQTMTITATAHTGISWGAGITESISGDTLTLSGTGVMNDFLTYEENKEKLSDLGVTKVVIGEGITYVGHGAFHGNALSSVTLPSSLTKIGSMAFIVNALTEITIPESVTHIGHGAFFNNQLESITMVRPDTALEGDLLAQSNNNFKTAYTSGGAGTYTGTQTGTWTKELTDTDKLAAAKASIEVAIDNLAVSNTTTDSDILTAATNATLHGVSVVWDGTSGFSKTNATSSAAGSTTGILNLTLNSESGTVEVNKIIAHLPPVANDSGFNVAEGSTHPGAVAGTGVTLTYVLQAGPHYGTLTFNADGSYAYSAHRQPTVGFVNSDSFTFLARDSANQDSNIATVTINIAPVNDAPVATSKSITTTIGDEKTGNVSATDIDGDALTYTLVTGPTYGTLTFNSEGHYSYTATDNNQVSDSFVFKANDGLSDSANATVTITLVAPPLSDTEKIAEAKTSIETALNSLVVSNATTAGDILTSATNATLHGVSVVWDGTSGFSKTNATSSAAGAITGILNLTLGSESDTVEVNKSITILLPMFEFNPATKTITGYSGPGGALEIPAEINGVKVEIIGDNAFRNKEINALTLGNSLTTIGIGAFSSNQLNTITIPNSVTSIDFGALFFNQLTSITMERGDTIIIDTLLVSTNNNFKDVYTAVDGGVGTYTGTQEGTWTKVGLSDQEKIVLAKTAIETALSNSAVSNATTAGDILTAAQGATLHGVSVVWDSSNGFSKTNATSSAAGAITGTLNLSLSGETNTVAVSKTIPKLPSTGGGSSGGSSTPSTPQTPTNTIVTINNEPVSAGTETKTTEDGKTTTLVQVNNEVIQRNIDEAVNNTADQAVNLIQIQVSDKNSDNARVELTGDIIKKLEENTFTVSVKNNDIEYIIPAKEFTISKVAETLNIQETDLKAITVEVRITKLDEKTIATYNESAKLNGAELVFPPVSFEVVAKTTRTDGSTEEVKISKFSNYVERVMEIPAGMDKSKITTGIVFNPDGTYSHVPTYVYQKDGKWYASINSLTNSTYSVIWNPITVKSVENHWAKDVVNDMASRLVIKNPETFMPDQSITRGEFAEYITKALGIFRLGAVNTQKFSDVEVTHELAYAIEVASEYGIISGYPDGSFKPDAQISREEAMAMYSRAMTIVGLEEVDNGRINSYTDKDLVASWAYNAVKKTVSVGVFNGKTNGTINPKDTFTCAEAATAIRNLLVASDLINK